MVDQFQLPRETGETFTPKRMIRSWQRRIYHKVMTEVIEGKYFERLPGAEKTFEDMMKKYLKEYSTKKRSKSRDMSSSRALLPFFGSQIVSNIAPSLIREYKNKRLESVAPSTLNRELTLLRHVFNVAIKEWEWLTVNPMWRVSFEKEPRPRDRWLTYEEERRLLQASPEWLRGIILCSIETGARVGEILLLKPKDVNLFKKTVRVFSEKTQEWRTVPLFRKGY